MAYKDKEALYRYNNGYTARSYDKVTVLLPKGERERVAAHARELGMTTSAYIVGLIRADMALGMIDAVTRGEEE